MSRKLKDEELLEAIKAETPQLVMATVREGTNEDLAALFTLTMVTVLSKSLKFAVISNLPFSPNMNPTTYLQEAKKYDINKLCKYKFVVEQGGGRDANKK